jgi:membrane-associated phospholipid phosphatase
MKLSCTSIFFSIAILSARAQDTSLATQKSNGYLQSFWHNGIALAISPSQWKGEEWAKFGGTLAISGGFISMDEPLSQPFFDWQVPVAKTAGNGADFLGNGITQFSISGLAIGAGAIAKSKPLINFGLDNLQAQLFTAGLTVLVKELTHRARPEADLGAYRWYGPLKGSGNASFFSGHTSLTFCTATMIYLHSHKKWWVGAITYTLATGVAVGRMQKQAHWASDVVVGAIIGSSVANFVYLQQEKRRLNIKKRKIIP